MSMNDENVVKKAKEREKYLTMKYLQNEEQKQNIQAKFEMEQKKKTKEEIEKIKAKKKLFKLQMEEKRQRDFNSLSEAKKIEKKERQRAIEEMKLKQAIEDEDKRKKEIEREQKLREARLKEIAVQDKLNRAKEKQEEERKKLENNLIKLNRIQEKKEEKYAQQQEEKRKRSQIRAMEAERKREYVQSKQINDERERLNNYDDKKRKVQEMERNLATSKSMRQKEVRQRSQINAFKIANVIDQANAKLENRKTQIIKMQQNIDNRIKQNRLTIKQQEELKKEKFQIKCKAKAQNVERSKKKLDYIISKTKERMEEDDKRKQSMLNHHESLKQMRLKNMQESELMREKVREALYHMSVWNVVKMDAINDILQGKQTEHTIGDIIRRKVGPQTVCNVKTNQNNRGHTSARTEANYGANYNQCNEDEGKNRNININQFVDERPNQRNQKEDSYEMQNHEDKQNILSKSLEDKPIMIEENEMPHNDYYEDDRREPFTNREENDIQNIG